MKTLLLIIFVLAMVITYVLIKRFIRIRQIRQKDLDPNTNYGFY